MLHVRKVLNYQSVIKIRKSKIQKKKDKQWSIKHYTKTKDHGKRTPIRNGVFSICKAII